MKISELACYPNFVFLGVNSDKCFSTTDVEILKHVKYSGSDRVVDSFEIGDKIYFDPDVDKLYEIKNIKLNGVTDDTDRFKYGIDLNNCSMQGDKKEILFKIQIDIKKV